MDGKLKLEYKGPLVLYGCVVGDFPCDMNEPADDLYIVARKQEEWVHRPICCIPSIRIVNPTTGLPDLTGFWMDPNHVDNQIAACVHRFGRDMPMIEGKLGKDFTEYAKAFIVTHFTPLQPDEVLDFAAWLDKTPYSQGRKDYLTITRWEAERLEETFCDSKSFLKKEGYGKIKQPRAINSYVDASKAILGPLQHAIDKKTFSTKWFVKGKNPNTWPQLLLERFGDNPVMGTDFSSFEAHHRGAFAFVVHYWVMHMVRDCGQSNAYLRLVSRMMRGTNKTEFSAIRAEIDERLMSGAMWTSSANGVLNLLIMSYLNARTCNKTAPPAELATNIDEYFQGFVEGDDGICIDRQVEQSLIDRLGVVLKFETASHFSRASFCGIVCDVSDPTKLEVIKDPIKVLRNFFIIDGKYANSSDKVHMALLRAKAYSLMCNHHNSPIIGPLCDKVCEMTRGVSIRVTSETDFKRSFIEETLAKKLWQKKSHVTPASRLLTEEMFGVTCEQQLRFERTIAAATGEIRLDLSEFASPHEREYIETNVVPRGRCCVRPETRPWQPRWEQYAFWERVHPDLRNKTVVAVNNRYLRGGRCEADDSVLPLYREALRRAALREKKR